LDRRRRSGGKIISRVLAASNSHAQPGRSRRQESSYWYVALESAGSGDDGKAAGLE
jgi:hypothetical protein